MKTRNDLMLLLLFVYSFTTVVAQTTREAVEAKITVLEQLMQHAREKKIDVTREELAVHTAQLFLDYADYDEEHADVTLAVVKESAIYKNSADKVAAMLPEFQRKESLLLLETTTQTLQRELNGEIKRTPIPTQEWADVHIDGSIFRNGKGDPVFLADNVWMPKSERYTKFYGNFSDYYMDINHLTPQLTHTPQHKKRLMSEETTCNIGSPFIGHQATPQWLKERSDEPITKGGRLFTKYDIDNPYVREAMAALLAEVAPVLKGSQLVAMGYALANEPHWHTAAKLWDTPVEKLATAPTNWDTGEVSKYTMAKFRQWLAEKHLDIDRLNKQWGTRYSRFDQVTLQVPVDNHLLGTPIWFDWMKFNQDRVTEWFTFMVDNIRKHDPSAIANVKVMPNLWIENKRDHGLDFEAICNLSGVLGNDAAAWKRKAWNNDEEWEKEYAFHWQEMVMGYDFFRSVSPDKPNYNSEAHYLQHVAFHDLELSKEYTRCTYWLSTILGCDAYTTWVWSRRDDGKGGYPINRNGTKDCHVGAITTQPRVLNEMHLTLMDLNAHANDISTIQNMRQPIRLFHSETSAINKRRHMSDEAELYDKLVFTGTPIGFVTQGIIESQDAAQWDVVLLRKTPYLTVSEMNALQKYLDNGGTLIVDNESALYNEYGERHPVLLNLRPTNGTIIYANEVVDFIEKAFAQLPTTSLSPLTIEESNSFDRPFCHWRAVTTDNGRIVLTLTNLGKVETTIRIHRRGESNVSESRNVLTGEAVAGELVIAPEQVLFVEL